jgi:hypothetical protein
MNAKYLNFKHKKDSRCIMAHGSKKPTTGGCKVGCNGIKDNVNG